MDTAGNIWREIRQRGAGLPKRRDVDPAIVLARVEFYRGRLAAWGYDERNPVLSLRLAQLLARLFDGGARKGILLQGVPGSGKTAGMRLVARYFRMVWWDAEDLQRLGAGARAEGRNRMTAVTEHAWQRPGDVVLDDLGAEETLVDYGNRMEPVAAYLGERYRLYLDCGRLTHITTNLDEAALATRYGERLTSRLHEMCRWIDCGKRDWREEL